MQWGNQIAFGGMASWEDHETWREHFRKRFSHRISRLRTNFPLLLVSNKFSLTFYFLLRLLIAATFASTFPYTCLHGLWFPRVSLMVFRTDIPKSYVVCIHWFYSCIFFWSFRVPGSAGRGAKCTWECTWATFRGHEACVAWLIYGNESLVEKNAYFAVVTWLWATLNLGRYVAGWSTTKGLGTVYVQPEDPTPALPVPTLHLHVVSLRRLAWAYAVNTICNGGLSVKSYRIWHEIGSWSRGALKIHNRRRT